MNKYYLMIKSHSEAPDFERVIQAKTKKEAVEIFHEELGAYGWNRKMIEANTVEESEMIT